MIDDALYSLLKNNVNLAAKVSTRIYLLHLPQVSTTVLPAVSFSRVSTTNRLTFHNGVVPSAEARFQFSCWGSNISQAKEVAELVRRALHGYHGTVGTETISIIESDNEVDLFDTEVGEYQVALDMMVRYKET
jgi:hypothetical protein